MVVCVDLCSAWIIDLKSIIVIIITSQFFKPHTRAYGRHMNMSIKVAEMVNIIQNLELMIITHAFLKVPEGRKSDPQFKKKPIRALRL